MKLFFCVAHYPVTLVYAVSLINALSHFLIERLHITGINRASLTLAVLLILHLVLSKGRDKVVSTLSALALPFAIAIIVIGVFRKSRHGISTIFPAPGSRRNRRR